MVLKLFLFLLLSTSLFSLTLNSTYYVHSKNIKLQDIVQDAPYDVTLYKIEETRYTKRVKSRKLIELLKKHGFEDITSSSRYVQFIKKSSIDTSQIEENIRVLYKEKYPSINIRSILIMPRGYIKSLPLEYEVQMQKKAHLSNNGTLSIKTLDKKKLFFDYTLDATVNIYIAKKLLKKGDRLSALNTTKKNIQFHKFKAMPITEVQLNFIQSKRNMRAETILTSRDIENLHLVKRGSNVSVNYKNNTINISFSSKALQNGKLNDIITIQKRDKTRLRAKVIGKNRVEIE